MPVHFFLNTWLLCIPMIKGKWTLDDSPKLKYEVSYSKHYYSFINFLKKNLKWFTSLLSNTKFERSLAKIQFVGSRNVISESSGLYTIGPKWVRAMLVCSKSNNLKIQIIFLDTRIYIDVHSNSYGVNAFHFYKTLAWHLTSSFPRCKSPVQSLDMRQWPLTPLYPQGLSPDDQTEQFQLQIACDHSRQSLP